jgi:pimeloyl-ACP methyl ester carboxylesterase
MHRQENSRRTTQPPSFLPILAAVFTAKLGLGLALIAWSRTQVNHHVPLTAALRGELIRFRGRRAGQLAYYVAGSTYSPHPPLLLLHSINASGSSFEMKPLFEHYAQTRRVIALDLPGFGFSDRSDRLYRPALFRDAILDLIEQELGGTRIDAVALSLSSEFLALAAQCKPAYFRSLSFLSPTGFSRRNQSLRANYLLWWLLRLPPWRRALYDLLTSRPSLRLFLQANQRTRLNQRLADYAYTTSHQPQAEHAPLAFISLLLFTPNIFAVYRSLPHPCLAIFGEDAFSRYDLVGALRDKANWRVLHLKRAGALVHWDAPQAVITALDEQLG